MLHTFPLRLHSMAAGHGVALLGYHDPWLVALSLAVAVLAAFAAFAAVDCVRSARRRMASTRIWLMAGAAALGTGIWTMHFVGMLAFVLPVPVHFRTWLTLLSIVPALMGSAAAVSVLARENLSPMRLQVGGLLLALGIGAMHSVGMEAMQMNATMTLAPALFALSCVVAYLLATLSLYARFALRRAPLGYRRPLAAMVLGCAVAGTHYTAMGAARFYSLDLPVVPADQGPLLPPSLLALLVCTFVALILVLTIVSTSIHGRMSAAQTRIGLLMEAGDIGLWEWDIANRTTHYSPEWKRQLGYRDDELPNLAQEWQTRLHPADREQARATLRECRDGLHRTYHAEYRLRHRDGAWRWFLSRGRVERDSTGQPIRMTGSHVDITERRQIETNLRASEQRMRTIFETEPQCVRVVAADGRLLEMNPAGLALLEADTIEDVQSQPLSEFLLPEFRASFIGLHHRVIDGEAATLQYKVKGLRGTERWLETHAAPMPDASGTVHSLLAVTRDVTGQKLAERDHKQHLALSNLGMQVALAYTTHHSLPCMLQACADALAGNLEVDAVRFWMLDRAAEVLVLQASAGPAVERTQDVLAPVRLDSASAIAVIASTGTPYLRTSTGGHEDWGRTDATTVFAGYPLLIDTRVIGVLTVSATEPLDEVVLRKLSVVSTNVSLAAERSLAETALRRTAMVDRLTDLPNRAMVSERLQHLFARSTGQPALVYAVLFIDLDNFKYVNDSLGHGAGDHMLIETARRLTRVLRQGDTLAGPQKDLAGRFGGDEFVVVLDQLKHPDDAGHVAERILAAMAEPFCLAAHSLTVSCSIGISTSQRAYGAVEDLLRDADTALYQAKAAGKANYVVFDESMHLRARKRLSLENDLRAAILAGQIVALYQPIIDLRTGRVSGFEALARWLHPRHGMIAPDEFIPIAEETGLIVPIGQLILDQAIETMERLSRLPGGENICMNVNVSRRQLVDASLLPGVEGSLKRLSVAPGRLRLEITETAVAGTPTVIRNVLEQLKALGVEIHLDDFGAGLSSLSLLRSLPLDGIKVDRSFIEAADGDLQAITILNAIIGLGHNLGKRITAEGIEGPAQVATVLALECDAAQGYLFGRPMTGADAALILQHDFSSVCLAAA